MIAYRQLNKQLVLIAFSPSGMGTHPSVPCGYQPSTICGRRPLSEQPHQQHSRCPSDEIHPRPPPPSYCGPPPFRSPYPPPYRFRPRIPYPPSQRPPLGIIREPILRYAPPRFRPQFRDIGGNVYSNTSANVNEYHPEQFTDSTVD